MERLTTYVHDYPVRASGVSYQEAIRKLAQYEDILTAPGALQKLLDNLNSEIQRCELLKAEVDDVADKLTAAEMELEGYRSEGSLMLFRLLKNKYRNEVMV